ncbi:MAG: DUF7511 domain-containing protein [Natronomonas sp.]
MTTTGEGLDGTDRTRNQAKPITLTAALVRYDGRPDRRTVYPPGLSGVARMSTWLTADADAFVDLDSAR